MLTTIISTAEKFEFFQNHYSMYEPTFVKVEQDGSVYFTLNFVGLSTDHIASLMFMLGQDYTLRQLSKTSQNAKSFNEFAYQEA
jgi:hypothetical protein